MESYNNETGEEEDNNFWIYNIDKGTQEEKNIKKQFDRYLQGEAIEKTYIEKLIHIGKTDQLNEGSISDIVKELINPNKQKLFRTAIHDVCLDQNFKILKMHLDKVIRNCDTPKEANEYRKTITNQRDFYNNNPLMLACIYQTESKI